MNSLFAGLARKIAIGQFAGLNCLMMKMEVTTRFCWMQDLEKARNVPARDRKGYEMLLSWFDTWRMGRQLPPGRESVRLFWKHQILSKPRPEWQLEQGKAAFLKK